jgi:hypothetical protein
MDLHVNKVWLPGAASWLLSFGLFFVFSWLTVYTNVEVSGLYFYETANMTPSHV